MNPLAQAAATALLSAAAVAACARTSHAAGTWPMPEWPQAKPAEVGMDEAKLKEARDYALTGGGSGFITRHGKLVLLWGDVKKRYDLKSSTKSIGFTAMGLAIKDGKLSLADRARDRHPQFGTPPESNAKTGWLDKLTLFHLATQTAGFEKPGGYEKLAFEPGTKWAYSDGGPNWLAECITLAYKRDLQELMFERVFTPLGITRRDLSWRTNAYRPAEIDGVARREFGSGIHANVEAMARIGYLYLRNGYWFDQQLLPKSFVDQCRTTVSWVVDLPEHDSEKRFGNASAHYGLLWWNNADGTLPNVPRDAYWSWGLYESLIVVIPSLDVVVARAGKSWQRSDWQGRYDILAPFFDPVVASVGQSGDATQAKAPYPPSQVITGLNWAPATEIIRKARGSDNWPLTWADDDSQYTAYGDGWGFEPRVPDKLSMGFARVSGAAGDLRGENLRTETGEAFGDGKQGKKASSLLMVDGTLYLWARNAGTAQLAWSEDHAKTWTWAPWKWTESFGFPTFLNFGKNYAGARDDYVYVYSFDSDSAYEPANRVVLARAPKQFLKQRTAYEFLRDVSREGQPQWTADLAERGGVFDHPARCYRFAVTYNAPLKRYLLCQIIPGKDTRFEGGFGIYDAPEPWGPWTTVYFTEQWDVGPGECCSLPTKWMSDDGKTVHLVFSGDDCFSVRKATLTVAR